jgi:hypothetical protein
MPGDGGERLYRFAVAPRFAPARGWPGRIARNGGVERERGTGRALPRDDWTPLDAAALATVVTEAPGRDAVLPPTHLGLLEIPERLRRAWWMQAERSGMASGSSPGFEKVFSEYAEFLHFKRLPLPERVRFEVTVSAPGLSSTRCEPDGVAAGLGFGDRPPVAGTPGCQPIGLVNLGDEATFVVLLDLPPVTLAARLEAASHLDVRALAPCALVARYLDAFPGEALLRVRLAPAEGLWLSPFGVVHDGWTHGKRDLDVMLRVGGELLRSPGPSTCS